MTVHCASTKIYEGKHHFQCPNLILNYLKLKRQKVRYPYPLSEMPIHVTIIIR